MDAICYLDNLTCFRGDLALTELLQRIRESMAPAN
jgi:hypothetical protein